MTVPGIGYLVDNAKQLTGDAGTFVNQLLHNQNPFSSAPQPAIATPTQNLGGNVTGPSSSAPSSAGKTAASAATTTASPDPASNQALASQFQNVSPLALQLFNNQVLIPWMKSLQTQQAGENQQYTADETSILNQPALKGNPQAAALMAAIPTTTQNQNLVMSALGEQAMVAPAANEAATQQANIQASLTQAIAQQQKLAAYQDPMYQLQAQAFQTGTTVPTQTPAYLAAQQAGASPAILNAIAASAASSG